MSLHGITQEDLCLILLNLLPSQFNRCGRVWQLFNFQTVWTIKSSFRLNENWKLEIKHFYRVDLWATDVYTNTSMKTAIHPDNYRLVVFEDLNNGTKFLTRSTVASEETTKWEDGNEYPLIKVHISSASHPFFTGEERIVDIEGRVDKFKARAAAGAAAREKRIAAAKKQTTRKVAKAEKAEDQKPEAKAEPKVEAKKEANEEE